VYLVAANTQKMNTSTDSESDDIKHIDAFIDSLSDKDIKCLTRDGIDRAPPRPFKPIR
jgi:hypothetical protein